MKNYIIEENVIPKNKEHHETLFALGNGFVGFRGSFYENDSKSEGCFVNTFYEEHNLSYGEKAYGFAEKTESMINIPNPKNITFFIDDEKCLFEESRIFNYKRTLNLKKGIVEINYDYEINSKRVHINSKALVSFNNKNLSFIKYEIKPINFSGNIKIHSSLKKESFNIDVKNDPRVSDIQEKSFEVVEKILDNNIYGYIFKTHKTKKELIIKEQVMVNKGNLISSEIFEKDRFNNFLTFSANKNEVISVVKINEIYLNENIKKLKKEEIDFEYQLKKQANYLDEFWKMSHINLENNEELTQGIRFNLFHLIQSVNREGEFGIAAKGLTGIGYEGHNFWDTEIFIFPYFLFTNSEIAKKILIYRYSGLEEAKKRAKELGCKKGAKFPWRTISGVECSGYFPAGTAQYHINADIAYAIDLYYKVTDDKEFMKKYGIEILIEIARFFLEVGYFNCEDKFKIDGVTGPDEYTAIVNNNYYTNKMVKKILNKTYDYIDEFNIKNISDKEINAIRKAYENMYLPFNDDKMIYCQDDTFLDKEKWDFKNTPKENYPLLLNYHPLKIYRYQVCKQADVCLADFLVGDDISKEIKKNNYDYYIDITTHDSSLSYNTYSIMACEIDYLEEAYGLYMKNVRLDIDNLHDNSDHGIHTAAMGGSWLGLVFGFAGLRIKEKGLFFNPKTTKKMGKYSFTITYKKALLKVSVDFDKICYEILEGKSIEFYSGTTKYKIDSKSPLIMI